MAGGQILAFPIDVDRRPYNTLALPCECVIGVRLRVMFTVRVWAKMTNLHWLIRLCTANPHS